ncbi:MAG TPA: DUF4389 domain-containing protein [Dehalococcoidia bacterium]|nr:DUF4389 domain-containing protein [Dehalococcoidia bacterium]
MWGAVSDYPVRFDVAYPEGENRWMLLIRWLLVIPHMAVVSVLTWVADVLLTLMLFILLFTARFPESIFGFMSGALRWQYNATAYLMFHNRYPPFSLAGEYPPVTFEVDRQETYNRWLPFVKWLLVFPHVVILAALGFAGFVVYFFVFFAVLVTGSYPRGAFDFLVGIGRWTARVSAYAWLLTDKYPPFSLH